MRALSSSWRVGPIFVLAVLMLGLVSSPAFAGKPTVAVLGLEVVDPTGQIDQTTTAVARDLTDALRSRAKIPSGPYQFQPGSEKELIDEKLIKNCDNEAVSCMAQIGKDLGADFLIYGRLEKKPDGYSVLINLLNVNKKKFEKARSPLVIPHGSAKDPTAIGTAAGKTYNDLVGVVSNGTLVVRSNADHGTVLLDNEPKGSLASGTLTLSLPEGPYRLNVEADGFERSPEIKVTLRSGETTNQSVQLVETKVNKKPDELIHTTTGTTSSSKSNIWKPMFVASTIIAVGAGGFWGFSYYKENSEGDKVSGELKTANVSHPELGPSNCGESKYQVSSSFKSACSWHDRKTYGIIGTGVGVALMAITGYLAFGRSDHEAAPPKTTTGPIGRRVHKPTFAVTPVVQADGGGASFRIDW